MHHENEGSLINLEQARKIATAAVLKDMEMYEVPEVKNALEDDFLESRGCWIFFRNKGIKVRPEHWFTHTYNAFAISKKGSFSQISTAQYTDEELSSYLQSMSDYFERNDK